MTLFLTRPAFVAMTIRSVDSYRGRRFIACSSSIRNISDRLTPSLAASRSISRRMSTGSRSVTIGSRPVAGRPRPLFLVLPLLPKAPKLGNT